MKWEFRVATNMFTQQQQHCTSKKNVCIVFRMSHSAAARRTHHRRHDVATGLHPPAPRPRHFIYTLEGVLGRGAVDAGRRATRVCKLGQAGAKAACSLCMCKVCMQDARSRFVCLRSVCGRSCKCHPNILRDGGWWRRGVGGRGGLCNSGQASFSSVRKTSRGRASGDTPCPLGRGVPSCLSLACPRGLVCFNYHGRHAF